MKSQSTIDINLHEQLKTLNEEYHGCYRKLLVMIINKTTHTIISNERLISEQMLTLEKELLNLLKTSNSLTFTNNNDALLLHIKITILCGMHASASGRRDTAFHYYYSMFQYLKNHSQLKYDQDVSFQKEIINAFDDFNSIVHVQLNPHFFSTMLHYKNYSIPKLQQKKNAVNAVYEKFKQKCNNTIVGLEEKFTSICNAYMNGYKNNHTLTHLNELHKNDRDDFFVLARNINNALETKKLAHSLTSEDTIHYLKLNFYRLNIYEITHPRSIWKLTTVFSQMSFEMIEPIKYEQLKDYIKYWLSLKDLYVTPSLSLIKSISMDELNTNIRLYDAYIQQLDKWLGYFQMPTIQFLTLTTAIIEMTESKLKLSKYFDHDIYEFLVKMQPQMEYLIDGIADIEAISKQCNHTFNCLIKLGLDTINKDTPSLNDQLNALRKNIDVLKQKKWMLANQSASELIHKEEEQKILHAEKMKKRKKPIEHVPILQQKIEESDSEDEGELETLNLISDELQELQSIDKTAFDLANYLQTKSFSICKMLEQRLFLSVPLTSKEHEKVYKKISYMLAEYYQLISLYEKHKCLSQRNTITEKIDIQDGILFSQETLAKTSLSIHENIQSVIELINKIKELQKISKDKKIYELGLNYANKHPDIHFTHEQIIQYGREEFKYIGKNKSDVSEHTKLKRFLDTTKYTFSALEYLQERIKPFIFENCNKTTIDISFFNHTDLWQAQFHGLLGCIFQSKFMNTNDTNFLSQAFTHFKTSYDAFSREGDVKGIQEVTERLDTVKNLLNNSENITLLTNNQRTE